MADLAASTARPEGTPVIVGSKYRETSGLTLTEVAKLIRADLKAAQEAGDLPGGVRFSVRTAGDSALCVTVKGYAGPIENPKLRTDPGIRFRTGWMDTKASEIAAAVREIVDAYNFDGSDIQSDYSNVRFYGHIEFEQRPGLACG